MTGADLEGTPTTIEARQTELEGLHREIFGQEKKEAPKGPNSSTMDLSDQELIDKAHQARNGDKFARLWGGDTTGYGTPSEADLALCSLLAFWTGPDPARIDRLFRKSGLMRTKWNQRHRGDGATYGAMTIDKALAGMTKFYTPGKTKGKQRKKGTTPGTGGGAHQEQTELDSHIERLNQRHAVVMLGGKCVILNEVLNPTFNRPDITFSGITDFKNFYKNERVFINGQYVDIAKIWLESPGRRQYEGIVFAPGKDKPGFYNLFRGFPIKPARGDWSLMRQHIFEVIADGDEANFKYLMAWMARLLQDPGGERPGTAIVLRGKQGVGKGAYASEFGKIFGSHFLHIVNPIQLVGRFNNHLKDCLLCFVDEGQWAGDKKAEGVLKGIITEEIIMCEPKGKDPFPIKNLVHLIIASNSQWVVPAGLEERRFLVLDVSDKHLQDTDYFAAIINQMSHGGREAMLFDLLEMDISGINLRKAPRTKALFDQVIDSMSTAEKFWYERLRAGSLQHGLHVWWDFIITETLYKEYLDFADGLRERNKLIDSQFGKVLRRLCPGMKRVKKLIDCREIRGYCFPSLEDCRSKFEALVGRKLDWGAEDEIKIDDDD
jgi:hypothetical protein